ncbi:hypothetical protein PFISCL1PPCAC_3108, partial [Pristionchus fissidentatus]
AAFASSLLPNYAFKHAIDAIREADLRDKSLWFSETSEAMPLGFPLIMMIVDTVLFFYLAIFIDWSRSSFENPLSIWRR